jgi:hypothetical protein
MSEVPSELPMNSTYSLTMEPLVHENVTEGPGSVDPFGGLVISAFTPARTAVYV